MAKTPTLGWQSWSPPYPRWHGLPRWDYSPFPHQDETSRYQSRRPLNHSIRYWCSWYALGTKINEDLILKTVSVINRNQLPFTHILIDDGWCEWGDWLQPDPTKFSNLKATVSQIHKSGYQVGLWFSPFLADRSSKLYQSHPEWFVKHKNRPVQGLKTIPIWDSLSSQRYLLNFTLPEVQNYTKQYLKQAILNWKVDLLKLDFLYSPYFDPNHTSPHIPTRHLNWLLTHIKTNYPHIQTVACGAPFKQSSNLVDAIRISKDTALPPFAPKILNKIFYSNRIKLLSHTLKAAYSPLLNVDPDVRLFSLDTPLTSAFWDTIHTPIIGVGDDLLHLSNNNIAKIKLWLTNHFSQS